MPWDGRKFRLNCSASSWFVFVFFYSSFYALLSCSIYFALKFSTHHNNNKKITKLATLLASSRWEPGCQPKKQTLTQSDGHQIRHTDSVHQITHHHQGKFTSTIWKLKFYLKTKFKQKKNYWFTLFDYFMCPALSFVIVVNSKKKFISRKKKKLENKSN